MADEYTLVRIEVNTHARLRRLIIKLNGDIVKGDIQEAVTEAVELYISENLPEGEEL